MERGVQKPRVLYRTHHDWDGDQSLSMTVIDAVSAVSNAEPAELPPLYESIDPDALDSLFTAQTEGRVFFEFAGLPVTVHATGEVRIHAG
jgi:hypothetical protein